MWIIYLESILALGLLVFIVWWTLPRNVNKGRDRDEEKRD